MKGLIALGAAVCALAVGVPAAVADGVWVGGTVHGLVTGPPSGGTEHPEALYVIGPVSRSHPLHSLADARKHGFGAHDHVAASVFSGPCDLMLVVPGHKAAKGSIETRMTLTPTGTHPLVYAVRLDGRMLPLTSAARIRQAQTSGLVSTVNTHNVISCTVSAG